MSTYRDWSKLRSDILQSYVPMGNPLYRRLGRRSSVLQPGSTIPQLQDYLFAEHFKITAIPPKLLNYSLSNGTVILSGEDLIVQNVPRAYTEKFLRQQVDYYVVDPVMSGADIVGGIRARLVHIDDSKPLSWSLILQRFLDSESWLAR